MSLMLMLKEEANVYKEPAPRQSPCQFKTGFSKTCVLEEEEVKPVQVQLIQNVVLSVDP